MPREIILGANIILGILGALGALGLAAGLAAGSLLPETNRKKVLLESILCNGICSSLDGARQSSNIRKLQNKPD